MCVEDNFLLLLKMAGIYHLLSDFHTKAKFFCDLQGILDVLPVPLKARDLDAIETPIEYLLLSGRT